MERFERIARGRASLKNYKSESDEIVFQTMATTIQNAQAKHKLSNRTAILQHATTTNQDALAWTISTNRVRSRVVTWHNNVTRNVSSDSKAREVQGRTRRVVTHSAVRFRTKKCTEAAVPTSSKHLRWKCWNTNSSLRNRWLPRTKSAWKRPPIIVHTCSTRSTKNLEPERKPQTNVQRTSNRSFTLPTSYTLPDIAGSSKGGDLHDAIACATTIPVLTRDVSWLFVCNDTMM